MARPVYNLLFRPNLEIRAAEENQKKSKQEKVNLGKVYLGQHILIWQTVCISTVIWHTVPISEFCPILQFFLFCLEKWFKLQFGFILKVKRQPNIDTEDLIKYWFWGYWGINQILILKMPKLGFSSLTSCRLPKLGDLNYWQIKFLYLILTNANPPRKRK